jgi:hypothetical protein
VGGGIVVSVTVWTAASADELEVISGVIHDSWFFSDEVAYDRAARRLVIPFAQEWDWPPLRDSPEWQHAPRATVVRRTWRYTEERVPFMSGELCIGQVTAVSQDEGIGDAAMLLRVVYEAARRLITVEGVSGDITANVERLDVRAELRADRVALHVRRRRGRLFRGESDVPLWSERGRRRPGDGRVPAGAPPTTPRPPPTWPVVLPEAVRT